MYVSHMRIEEFRCFAEAELSLVHPHDARGVVPKTANVTLILGDNGAGKSAVLKALAIGLLYPVLPSSGFRPYMLVRRSAESGFGGVGGSEGQSATARIALSLVTHDQDLVDVVDPDVPAILPIEISAEVARIYESEQVLGAPLLPGMQKAYFTPNHPSLFVVGYGTGRRVESGVEFNASAREKSRDPRYMRVASLFEDDVTLVPIDAWQNLAQAKGRWDENVNLLNEVLPAGVRLDGKASPDARFLVKGVALPFGALSDGYRTFVGWVIDLLYHLTQVAPAETKLTDLRGLVMVDEIDHHLHPKWQRTVVGTLATAFPNLQFVLTTHSPIVTGTVEAANLRIAEREEGRASLSTSQESVHGLSSDQILTGSYFGLRTTRAPEAEAELHAVTERAWAGDEEAGLEYLRRLREGAEIVESVELQ